MIEVIFLVVLALIWILFASIRDLQVREVPDWLSFSLIIFALGFRFFYSLFFSSNSFAFFYHGLAGLGFFFVLGNLLYHGRLFAGGDAKLMISLGPILAFSENFFTNLKIFFWFIFLFLLVGAVYGLIWSSVLAVKNFKDFKKEFVKRVREKRKWVYLVMIFGLFFMVLGFFESLLLILGGVVFVLPYFYFYAKSVDEACMIKNVPVAKLTEGDWIYKDLKVGKKIIRAEWSGLTKKQINMIKTRYKLIKIRYGIPFIPVFFISFLVFLSINYFFPIL